MPTPTPMPSAQSSISGTMPSVRRPVKTAFSASATCPMRRPPKRRMKQPAPSIVTKPEKEIVAIRTPRKAGSNASAGNISGAATGIAAFVIEEKVCCASIAPAASVAGPAVGCSTISIETPPIHVAAKGPLAERVEGQAVAVKRRPDQPPRGERSVRRSVRRGRSFSASLHACKDTERGGIGVAIGFRINECSRRVDAATVARFRDFPVANVSDVMARMTAGGARLRPMHRGGVLAGPAFTVKTRPGDNLMVHRALDIAEPGDVIVVDAGGDLTNAIIGELMLAYAIQRRLGGIV